MLGPKSTIKDQVTSNEAFSVGCIATILVACEQNTSQYELSIKDGKTTLDYANVILFVGRTMIEATVAWVRLFLHDATWYRRVRSYCYLRISKVIMLRVKTALLPNENNTPSTSPHMRHSVHYFESIEQAM